MDEIVTRSPAQLGAAIRRLREAEGLSQAALAAKAAKRQETISKFETAETDSKLSALYAVAAALGYDVVLRKRPSGGGTPSIEDVF